ncbi:Putative actin-assembly inducing protein [Listeria ivanovii subsp. ivanovii PAM 55]|uniref:Putative actin-assembly inducing protein n=3 Tax=Listeria ivanovii TaxID=1638 RepID=G2Z9J1_LISIP|nr:actin assembly-inducing protein ActA [Listeria ivanovii]CBW84655.1 Putative actin-assembly inducing protein [Listeria ivanovii subsp. ivanovii PAM 55]
MKLDRFLRAMMAVCFTASCILVNPGVIFASNSTVSTSSNENSNLESDEQGEGEQAEGKVEEGRNSPGHGAISEACARDIQELGKTGEAKSANVPDSMTTPDSGLSKEPGQNIGETVTKSKPPSVRKRFKRCVEKVLKGKRNKSSKEETKTTKKKQESSKLQPKELVPHPSIANQSFWRRLSDKIKPVVTSNDDNDSRIDSDEWDDGEEAKEKVEEGKAEEEKNNLGQEEISEERERDLQELEKMGKVKNANVTALLAMLDSRAGKVARQDIKETLNDEVPAVLFHPKRSIKEILSDEQNRVPMNSGKIKNRRKAIEGSDMEDSDMEDADTEEKPLAHGATGPLRTMNPSTSEETSEKIQSNENNEESSNQSQFDLLSSSTEEGLRIALPEPPGLLGFNMQNNELESSVSEPSSFNLSSPPTEEELAAMGITLSVTPSVEEESSLHLPKEDAPQSLTANPSLEFPSPPTEEELAAMDMKQSIAPTVEGESSLRPSREDAPQSLTANPSLEFPSPPTEEELAAMDMKQSIAPTVEGESSLRPSREDSPQSLTANPSLEFPSPPTEEELAAMDMKQSIAPTVEGESSLRPSREDAPQSLTANPSLEFPSPPTEEELAAMGIKQSMALSVGEESSLHPSREDVPQSLTANPSLEFPSPPTRAELAAMGIFMFNDGLLRGDLGSAGNAIERQSSSCLDSPTCSYFYGFHTDDEYSDSEDELDSLLNPKVTAIGETKKTSQQYRKVGFMPFVPLLEKPFAGGNGTLAEEQIIKNPLGKTKQELQLQDSIEQQLTLAKKLQDNAEKAAETTEVSKTNETTKTNETIKTAILPKTEPAEGLSLLTNSTQTVGSTLKVSRNKLHSPQKTTGTLKSENSSLIPAGMPIIPLESLEKRKEQPKTNLAEGTLKNNKLVEKSEGKNTPSRSGSEKLVAKSAEREKTNQEAGNNTVLMYALVAIGIISLAVIIKIIRTRKSD